MGTSQFEGYYIKFQHTQALIGPVCVFSKESYTDTSFLGKVKVKYYDTMVARFDTLEQAREFIDKQLALKEKCDKDATLYRVK